MGMNIINPDTASEDDLRTALAKSHEKIYAETSDRIRLERELSRLSAETAEISQKNQWVSESNVALTGRVKSLSDHNAALLALLGDRSSEVVRLRRALKDALRAVKKPTKQLAKCAGASTSIGDEAWML